MAHATHAPRVLVTGGRFMPATGIVHALRRVGARIDVLDSIGVAPALHSRGVVAHITASPAVDPVGFTDEVAAIARERAVDVIFSPFEESFFLSRYRDRLPVPLFVPTFGAIEKLHDKAAFVGLCAELGLATPKTEIVTSQEALRSAIERFGVFFARPAFTRGGDLAMTNHGADAGEPSIEGCHPSAQVPWLVQSFVEGQDTCIFALARDGKVEIVGAYEPSLAATGGYAIRFTTIDDPAAVDIAQAVCGHVGYTGLIGFDYRRTAQGPVLLECNPRTTAGCFLVDEALLGRALLDGLDALTVIPPGRTKQYDSYIIDRHTTDISTAQLVRTLFSAPDAMVSQLDVLPFVYSFIRRSRASRDAYRQHVSLTQAA
ncbi:MAG: ATP-grasp domain-containing protein, partial [Pseudomonadota bacterium]